MNFSHFWEVPDGLEINTLIEKKLVIFGIFKILLFFSRNLYLLKIKGHYPAHLNARATLVRPGRCLRLTITDIIMKNGHTRRANTAAVYQGIYAYSCLAGGCRHLPLRLFFFLHPLASSLRFISICPHFASSCGCGVKAEMQGKGRKCACVYVCACVSESFKESVGGTGGDEGERQGKVSQCMRWQVWEGGGVAVWVSSRVGEKVSDP